MKVSWNWLKEYVRLDLPIETLIDRLVMAGLNHESTDEAAGDLVVDFEVTSNRPDCLGHIGIAREVSVLFGHPLLAPPTNFEETAVAIESLTSVEITPDAKAWCPQYRARVVEGIKVGPSPSWMRRRLEAVGLTPINNVVDITNYVLLECGQPLHAFDFDKLDGKRIVVRGAGDREKFLAINNKEYALESWMGSIADAGRTVALAGVMGGAETEVSSTTTRVLLESAEFAPLAIRRTSRFLDLSSESSYRFERKIDPAGVAWASDRACHLLEKLAGGKVARGAIHVGDPVPEPPAVELRFNRIERILGIDVPADRAVAILESLGLKRLSWNAAAARFRPPTFRRDLTREIDLVEEVGRIHGYAAVPEDRTIPLIVTAPRRRDVVTERVREILCACGYHEAVTFSFIDPRLLELVRPWTSDEPLAVKHSIRRQENQLRQSLIPSLLRVLRTNEARGNVGAAVFEVAHAYLPKSGATMPDEPRLVGLAADADFRAVRGHIESIFDRLRIRFETELSAAEIVGNGVDGSPLVKKLYPADVPGFAPGRSAEYQLDGVKIGVIGQASDEACDALDLRARPVVAELLLQPLVDAARLIPAVTPIPDQPAVERDLAVVLDEDVRWSAVEAAVRKSAGECLESLAFLDLYRGKQVEAGKKSIAFRIVYRAKDRTLSGEEVDQFQAGVVAALAALGGSLRA